MLIDVQAVSFDEHVPHGAKEPFSFLGIFCALELGDGFLELLRDFFEFFIGHSGMGKGATVFCSTPYRVSSRGNSAEKESQVTEGRQGDWETQ